MEEPTTKITLPNKDLIQSQWRNPKLYRQAKVKRIQHHQTSPLQQMLKELLLLGNTGKKKGPTETNPKQLQKL